MVGKLGGKLAMFENKSAAAADTPADKGAGPKPSPPSTAVGGVGGGLAARRAALFEAKHKEAEQHGTAAAERATAARERRQRADEAR